MTAKPEDLVYRLRKRAEIRRLIPGRRAALEGKPDRIADLFDEAAANLEAARSAYNEGWYTCSDVPPNNLDVCGKCLECVLRANV